MRENYDKNIKTESQPFLRPGTESKVISFNSADGACNCDCASCGEACSCGCGGNSCGYVPRFPKSKL
jgi:hypothetical protein